MNRFVANLFCLIAISSSVACRHTSDTTSETKDGVANVGQPNIKPPMWNSGSEMIPFAAIAYEAPQLDAICQSLGHQGWVLRSPIWSSDQRKSGYFAVPTTDGVITQQYKDDTPILQNITCEATGDNRLTLPKEAPLERTFAYPKWGKDKTAVYFAAAKLVGQKLANFQAPELTSVCQYLGYAKWAECRNPKACDTFKTQDGERRTDNYAVPQLLEDETVVIKAENLNVAPIKEIRCLKQ